MTELIIKTITAKKDFLTRENQKDKLTPVCIICKRPLSDKFIRVSRDKGTYSIDVCSLNCVEAIKELEDFWTK